MQPAQDSGKSALGRFASLRKGGRNLGKGVRNRLSRSLYLRSNSEDPSAVGQHSSTGQQQQQQPTPGKNTGKAVIPERKSRNKLCLLI